MRNGIVLALAAVSLLIAGGAILADGEKKPAAGASASGASAKPAVVTAPTEAAQENHELLAPPVFAPNEVLGAPVMPETPYLYADADLKLPEHFTGAPGRRASIAAIDNTPDHNPVTNAGAALGRVLFYDKRLSANDTIACGSCHLQEHGFSDPAQFSVGFKGGKTKRHSMSLTNARYGATGRFFWDERAKSLEEQVLMPIQDPIEMGMNLKDLERKLAVESFYPPLFTAAFGSPEITSQRISLALAQFVRSMVSFESKFDKAYAEGRNGQPNFRRVFNEKEMFGLSLFAVVRGSGVTSQNCSSCHFTAVQSGDNPRNNGVDDDTASDKGAGAGRFKAPSLRNIAVSGPYMHDGRFKTLREVIEFYGKDVKAHSYLDGRLRDVNGEPRRPVFSEPEIEAMLAFFDTLTDEKFLKDPKFADPFPKKDDAKEDGAANASGTSGSGSTSGDSGESGGKPSGSSMPVEPAKSGAAGQPKPDFMR